MPVTTRHLLNVLSQPAPPDPVVPEWLVRPLALHDLDECDCGFGDGPCVAALWDERAIDTNEARERLGV